MTDDGMLNFFAYIKNENGEKVVKRIPLSRDLQRKLSESFIERGSEYSPDNASGILKFEDNIHYKPEKGELFIIENFEMPYNITNAINNPLNIDNIAKNDYEKIKAIFCARRLLNREHKIMFTTFDARKIIKSTRLKTIIFYKVETFTDIEDTMIVIDEKIDVLYSNNNLYFHSFDNAKKIFGDMLNEYYREATDEEVEEFSRHLFDSEIPEDFIDYRSRKLIFGIMKSGVPEVQRVVDVGKEKFGIELEITEGGKLAIPENKKNFKRLLKLLNDDLLESPLTDTKYETNSKRKIP